MISPVAGFRVRNFGNARIGLHDPKHDVHLSRNFEVELLRQLLQVWEFARSAPEIRQMVIGILRKRVEEALQHPLLFG